MRFASVLLAAMLVVGSVLVSTHPVRAASAVQIFAVDNCLGDLSFAGLSWAGVDPAADEISLDLSYLDNGFREGTFRNSGPLPATARSVIWDNLPAGRTFFIRLNQSFAGQSLRSATYFFQTCSTSGTLSTYPPPVTTLAAFTAPSLTAATKRVSSIQPPQEPSLQCPRLTSASIIQSSAYPGIITNRGTVR